MVYSENGGKSKDSCPLETVQKIRNILASLGVLVTENWYDSVNGIYSVQLISEGTRFAVNGKGTSKEYALASGYGEFMERLQNGVLYRYKTKMSSKDNHYKDFAYAPDEKSFTLIDLLNLNCKAVQESLQNNTGLSNYDMLSKWADIQQDSSDNSSLISLPFYNVQNSKIEYIPVSILDHKYGTNGMCAGNTPQEAIVQGLSEIIERYVNFRIIEDGITPPTIPETFIDDYPTLVNMKKEIESSGPYKVILKDCSLGEGIPAVGMILINNKEMKYFVKFASHPRLEIAIERTFTELLQGRNIREMSGMSEFHFDYSTFKTYNNKMNIITSGDGYYPDSLFREHSSYPLSSLEKRHEYTNSQMLMFYIDWFTNKRYDVLIRDVSFMDFPAFYIVVPRMSETTSDNEYTITHAENKIFLSNIIMNFQNASNDEIKHTIHILDSQEWQIGSPMSFALPVKMNKKFSWHKIHYGLFKSCSYLYLKQYDKAIDTLHKYIRFLEFKEPKHSKIRYYRCIANFLEALYNGCLAEDAIEVMKKFYSLQLIKDSIKAIEEPFAYILPFNCFDCEGCYYQRECIYHTISSFHRKWKDEYKKANINQEIVSSLF